MLVNERQTYPKICVGDVDKAHVPQKSNEAKGTVGKLSYHFHGLFIVTTMLKGYSYLVN